MSESTGARTVLAAMDLSVRYGPIRALRTVSIRVGEGRTTAVLGANGAGKSTLMRAVAGLVPVRSGVISCDPAGDVTSWGAARRCHETGIALVPEGRAIFSALTTEDNLRLGLEAGRRRTGALSYDQFDSLDGAYEIFPVLHNRRRQPAGYLSGGEQQMLAVARGLLMRPRILLLDEPSIGLAPLISRQILEKLAAMQEATGLTIVLVEQNAQLALEVARYCYVLEEGQVSLEGTTDDLRLDTRLTEAYLGG